MSSALQLGNYTVNRGSRHVQCICKLSRVHAPLPYQSDGVLEALLNPARPLVGHANSFLPSVPSMNQYLRDVNQYVLKATHAMR